MSEGREPQDNIAVEMEMDLEEDIATELEDLVLYSRLGMVADATELIEEVLLRHIHYFPVFAEITAFLAGHGDKHRLKRVCDLLASADGGFVDSDENLYTRVITLEVQHRLSAQCELALSGYNNLSILGRLFNEPVYDSTTVVQSLETALHSLIADVPSSPRRGTDPLIVFVEKHFQRLHDLGYHWEASQMFTILCHIYPIRSAEAADPKCISSMYEAICHTVGDATLLQRLTNNWDASMPHAVTALFAKISLMLYIVRIYEADIEVLVWYVVRGLPPLRKVFTEASLLLGFLLRHQGLSEDRSIFFNICRACMQNWKYSEAAAETVRRLNNQIRKFNEGLSSSYGTAKVRQSSFLPEIVPHSVTDWMRNPPPVA